jgi:NAD+ synthase (glutamine-hydrolysing)
LGQFNAIVGDIAGNARKMREMYARAIRADVDLLVFPELAVCGYPPEDLLHKRHFLKECSLALEKLAADCPQRTIVVGFPENDGAGSYNSAAVLQGAAIIRTYRKALLPNYGVFDEQRYFRPGTNPLVLEVGDLNVAFRHLAHPVAWQISGKRRANPNDPEHFGLTVPHGQAHQKRRDNQ